MNLTFLLEHRNWYSEGTDDAQKTPRGHPDFNSHVQNQRVFIFQTDRQTDGEADREIHSLCVGWRNLFPVVLCCVSFWFWQEKDFGLHTNVLLRVQYSCGVVLVFWLRREIVFGVMYIFYVQYSCAVVSVIWL